VAGRHLRCRGISVLAEPPHRIAMAKRPATADYLTQNEAASHLGVSRNGLLGLERMGAIARRQVVAFAPWRVERRLLDSEHVQALVRTMKTNGRLPTGGRPEGQLSLLPLPGPKTKRGAL
jgi:hypothetical protein